jgi:hypothetical protein
MQPDDEDRVPFFDFIEDKDGTWWGIMVLAECATEEEAADWFEDMIDRDVAVVELDPDVAVH